MPTHLFVFLEDHVGLLARLDGGRFDLLHRGQVLAKLGRDGPDGGRDVDHCGEGPSAVEFRWDGGQVTSRKGARKEGRGRRVSAKGREVCGRGLEWRLRLTAEALDGGVWSERECHRDFAAPASLVRVTSLTCQRSRRGSLEYQQRRARQPARPAWAGTHIEWPTTVTSSIPLSSKNPATSSARSAYPHSGAWGLSP